MQILKYIPIYIIVIAIFVALIAIRKYPLVFIMQCVSSLTIRP